MLKFIILAILYLATILFAYYFGANIAGTTQLKLIELIITFSSVIFAVLGVWLAIVFPEVMNGVYKKPSVKEKKEEIIKGKRLFIPLGLASLVVATNMLARIVAESLRHIDSLVNSVMDNRLFFVFISLSVITLLLSMILALAPGIQMLFNGSDEIKKAERKDRYLSIISRNNS